MANIVLDFLHNYQTGERRETEPANAYQYDEGHVLEADLPEVITACEIHYWIRGMEEADAYTPTSITPNSDGSCTVLGNIPNKYFETNGELRIYIVVTDGTASITTYEGKLHICQRSMPDDYVDDDPENEATRILTEVREAAATATAAAQTAQDVADSIPADYTQLSDDVDTLKEDISDLREEIEGGGSGLTDTQKALFITILRNALYSSDQSDNIDALEESFTNTVISITAVLDLAGNTIYSDDSLDTLRQYLTVKANYDDGTKQVITDYILAGTLVVPSSTIQVGYRDKTASVTVPVSQAVTKYTITNNLTGVTNSNESTVISEGNTYIGVLSANTTGYMVTNVSITVGSTDVTSTAYNSDTNTITIENVQGDISITASEAINPLLPVYTLTTPMTENGVLDYVLFDQDTDWTIEWTVSTPANSGNVSFNNVGDNNTHPFMATSDYVAGTKFIKIWDSANQTLNDAWLNGTVAGEQKIVITHDIDGDTKGYWYQSNMKSGRESYGQGSKTLTVGSSTTRNSKGITVTISNSAVLEDFKIYKRVLTASEISEYVGWTVE